MAKIRNITDSTKSAIKRMSAYVLPNRPSDAGWKADDIRKTLYQPITDSTKGVLTEIDRVIDDVNVVMGVISDKYDTLENVVGDQYSGTRLSYTLSGGELTVTGVAPDVSRDIASVVIPLVGIINGEEYLITSVGVNALSGVASIKVYTNVAFDATSFASNVHIICPREYSAYFTGASRTIETFATAEYAEQRLDALGDVAAINTSCNNSRKQAETYTYGTSDGVSVPAYAQNNAKYFYEQMRDLTTVYEADYSPSLTLTTGKGGLGVKGIKGGSHKSKNLIKPTLATTTTNGVTITNNGDGTYSANGTASANANFIILSFSLVANTQYKFVGCPSHTQADTRMYFADIAGISSDYGNGVTFSVSSNTTKNVYIRVAEGEVCNNLVFKPMLVDATLYPSVTYADYEPYGIVNAGQMGCVDLGDLSWTAVNDASYPHRFGCTLPSQMNINGVAFCNGYTFKGCGGNGGLIADDRSFDIYIDGVTLSLHDERFTSASEIRASLDGVLLAYELADGQSADEYALVVKEHNEGSSLSDNLIIPLDSPICRVGNVTDEITERNGVWGVMRRCEISNNEVVALTTPTFEPFSDQTVMLRLKSYSGKTYVTTQEGLAQLSVRYGKTDLVAEVLKKI